MAIQIINTSIPFARVKELAETTFGDMVKGVADINESIMALGGELHTEAEAKLLERGSEQKNLWGFNLYPELDEADWI